ncbi:putative sulfate exporter family transporter [uncultured Sanguibacteroides sp.]|uniref:YeiH family protein n=1 Tax=uncultured Sanguibacteroides sp. TaxID=1635151 RepID=UPI0025EAA6BC|nr:putative sulfate exporter family transporter [uncultured Sanguibacteroides sp.]
MSKFKISEDWTSAIVGWFIILLIIFQLKPHWPSFSWPDADVLMNKVFALDNVGHALLVFGFMFIMALIAGKMTGRGFKSVIYSFPVVFFLTLLAMVVGGNKFLKDWGLETVIFSLLIGLFISNVFSIPKWLKESLSSELFVKIGLVLLGTTVLFGDLLKSGSLGLIQSCIVVFVVWNFCFWLCKRMGIDKEMALMLSSAVSICGVSAAVATAGAIKGDKTKLSYVVSLVLVVAVPMIILMPALAKLLGLPEDMAGAWIGGTIDTTGAVAATGAIYGEVALQTSTIVKFSQNVLLGIAAFLISIYWSYTKKEVEGVEEKPTLKVIWTRFPKFVLGFVAASLVFSFMIDPAVVNEAKPILKNIQGLWFALAFTSIGLETDFRSLITSENRRSTYAFLGAQTFNVFFTLLIAWLLFGVLS